MAEASPDFEIHYRCSRSWGTAFIHYSLDDGVTWSLKTAAQEDGAELQEQSPARKGERVNRCHVWIGGTCAEQPVSAHQTQK